MASIGTRARTIPQQITSRGVLHGSRSISFGVNGCCQFRALGNLTHLPSLRRVSISGQHFTSSHHHPTRYFSKMAPQQAAPASATPSSKAVITDGSPAKKKRPAPGVVRPSSSILLVSHTNQVLLLHRVQTSRSFASAHVFPGGNLSSFHEGPLPGPESAALHEDSQIYRLAAVRETFEESGILLARKKDGTLLELSSEAREEGRKAIHGNSIKFTDWLASVGGVPDTDGLVPFTRWITPTNVPRRFSTQMYLYMLPLSSTVAGPAGGPEQEILIQTPTHDGGLEHTAAAFDDASTWMSRAQSGEIILFPPQFFLLHIVSQFLKGRQDSAGTMTPDQYQTERDALLEYLNRTPTVRPDRSEGQAKLHPTAAIPWAQKAISPTVIFMRRSDGRVVLGLDKPGPELKGTKRGGDWDRVVLVHFKGEGPRNVEVRWREDVVREEREFERREEEGKGAKL